MEKSSSPQQKHEEQPKQSSAKTRTKQSASKSAKPKRKPASKAERSSSAAPFAKPARGKRRKTTQSSPARRQLLPHETAFRNMLAQFESAVELLNNNHLAKARKTFEKLAETATPDLAQRARMYRKVCEQRISRPKLELKSAEDHYNYGVQLANQGFLDEAEQYLLKALQLGPQFDYVHYALASTCALREDPEQAMAHLEHAIELNDQNRYLAQNDPDFDSLSEDPRFTELLYPEKPM